MEEVKVYTDGSCLGNPGIGGWAFVIVHDEGVTCRSGNSQGKTTNNIMELTAIIKILEYASIHSISNLKIYSDSKYCILGITKWIQQWEQNDWMSSAKRKIKNADLWKTFHRLKNSIDIVTFEHVKAHNGDKYNTMVDELARIAASKYEVHEVDEE